MLRERERLKNPPPTVCDNMHAYIYSHGLLDVDSLLCFTY